MPRTPPPDDPVPAPTKPNIDACRRCELWEKATQGVTGRGSRKARIMLVGEQPGDEEDKQGAAFVGPAGQLLRRAIADAGLTLDDVYLTNAVKHFYWEPRGPRRIHKTPAQRHIDACRAWLAKEIERAKPGVIVALGSTALNGVMGGKMKVGEAREATLSHAFRRSRARNVSPVGCAARPHQQARAQMYATIVADLEKAARLSQNER